MADAQRQRDPNEVQQPIVQQPQGQQQQAGPPPVQQQNLGQVQGATDQRIQQAVTKALGLDQQLPRQDIEQRASSIENWANQVKGVEVNGRIYTPQAQEIADLAQRARQTGDQELLAKAASMQMVFYFGAYAQYRADQSGSAEARQLSNSLQNGWGLLSQPGGLDRLGASISGTAMFLDNPQIYNAPGNEEARRSLLGQVSRLTDPSVRMGAEEISQSFQSIQQNFALAAARVGDSMALQNVSVMLQTIMASDLVKDKMKDQVDKLLGDLASAWAKVTDSKKDKEEKEKELAELEKKAEGVMAKALKMALEEAGAPKELITAVDGAAKLLESKSAILRARGQQLLNLGMVFLQNKKLMLANKPLLNKLLGAAKMVAGGKETRGKVSETIASLHKDLGKALEAVVKAKSEKAKALESLAKAASGLLADVEKAGSKPLKEAASRLLNSIQERLKKGENITAEYMKGVAETLHYLKGSLGALLGIPAKTDKEKKEKEEAANLIALAVDSAVKDAKSEITTLLKFMSALHIGASGTDLKGFLAKLGQALSGGKVKPEEAKSQLAERYAKEGEAAEADMRKSSPKLADALGSVFKPLKGGKPDLGMISKANQALGIANFVKDKVLPHKSEEVKKGALQIVEKSVSAMNAGNFEASMQGLDLANKLVEAPEETALAAIKEYEAGMQKAEEQVKDALRFERKAILEMIPSMPKDLQARMEKTLKEIDEMLKGPMDEAKVNALLLKVREMKRMGEDIQKADNFELKKSLADLYCIALDKLDAGERGQYDALMLAAKELKANAAFGFEAGSYRKGIMEQVTAMKDPAKAKEAMSKLISFIGASLTKKLQSIKGLDESTQELIGQVKVGNDVASLERARAVLEVAKSIGDYFGSSAGKRLDPEKRNGATKIYNRALGAAIAGMDPSVIGAQKFLAEKYIASQDAVQRAELESLSARVEKNPESAADIETYIQINDRLALAQVRLKDIPKDSPLKASLEELTKELARVRSMIAKGESLVDPKKAEAYKAQVIEMLKNPEVRSKIESRAKEIQHENQGMSIEEAMELSVSEAAHSAAMVAERERVKGLLALSEMIGKAGPKVSTELAGIFDLASKSYLKGDTDKGAIFISAAASAIASPAEINRIAEIASGVESGKIPIGTGMFLAGLMEQRAAFESKISDKGVLANAKAYFDLAELAALNGDIAGAQEIRQMALAYSSMGAVKDSALDKDSRKRRPEAMASIEKTLGDYRKAPLRVREMKAEEAAAPAAIAVLSKKPLKDALGEKEFKALQSDAAGFTKTAFILARLSDFDDILGSNPQQAKAIDERWDSEQKRLKGIADQHRNAGRIALAEYYDAKAAESDRAFVKDAVAKAKGMLEKAASELERSEKLNDEGDDLLAKSEAAAKAGNADEAARLQGQAKAKYEEATVARQNADKLSTVAGAIDDNLSALDLSVRKINTINREKGRFQLNTAVKLNLAVGLGYDADQLGEPKKKDGQNVPLPPEREATLFKHAGMLGETGKRLVQVQQQIMSTRDAGIAAAKANLHDANIQKAKDLIKKLANLNPELAKVDIDKAEELIKAGDFDGLQKHYFNLANQQGVKLAFVDHDGVLRTAFDPLENEKRYQNVVGLYWSERFGEASAASRAAKFDMDTKAFIAGLKIDDVRLTRQLKAVLPPPRKPGQPLGGFPVGSGEWGDPRSYQLLKQIIAHMDPETRAKYEEKLEKIPKGPDGDFARQFLYEDLAPFMDKANWGGKNLADKITDGDLIYFDTNALIGKAVAARGTYDKGSFGAADLAFNDLKFEADAAIGMQEADTERVAFDYKEYEYTRKANYAKKDYLPEEIPIADESASGAEKKKNLDDRIAVGKSRLALEPAVTELEKSLKERAKANKFASGLALKSRDAIQKSGIRMQITEEAVDKLIGNLVASGRVTDPEVKKMLDDLGNATTLNERNEKMLGIWGHLVTKAPDILVFAVQEEDKSPRFSDGEMTQLRAFSGSLLIKSGNYDWDTAVEPFVSKRLQTARGLHERAMIVTDKDEKRRLYELASHPIAMAKGLARDGYGWIKDPERMKTMLKNDEWVNQEAYKMILKKADISEDAMSYNSADLAKMKTDFQLWLSGFRRKADGTVERFQMTGAEYKRIADAYGQFLHMENDLMMKAGIGVWSSNDEFQYLKRVGDRSAGFYKSAEIIVDNPGGRYLSAVLADSEAEYEKAVPLQERKGKLFDPDYETMRWTRAKMNSQAFADIAKGVGKMVAYSVGFALAPVTGGASAYLAGGIAATEGFIGAAEYLESCGGDLGAMNASEQANFFFQIGMATASAVAPVVGELAQAKNAARLLQIGANAERALAPTAIEITSLWLGRAMVAGGLVQSGLSMYNLAQMAESGQMPMWAAIAQGLMDGLQGGMQPGLHAIRGARVMKTGLPTYRSKALQIGEMIIFGTPLESRRQYQANFEAALHQKAAAQSLAKLPAADQQAFTKYVHERNISPERQVDLHVRLEQARSVEKDLDFNTFTSLSMRYDNYKIAGGKAEFGSFVKRETALEGQALKEKAKFAKEARAETDRGTSIDGIMKKAADFEKQADSLPAEKKADAIDLYRKAKAYQNEAERRRGELASAAGKTLDQHFGNPEIVKNYNPGDSKDQIGRLAKVAEEKISKGEKLQPHEQAALDFVRLKAGKAPSEPPEITKNAEAAAKKEAESGTPVPQMRAKAEEMEQKAAKLPADSLEALSLRRTAEAYRKEAERRQGEADAALRDELSAKMSAVKVGEEIYLTPVKARPENAYSLKHSAAAVEVSIAAEQVVRGYASIDQAAAIALANLKKRGIEADRAEVLNAVSRLAQDKSFISASELAKSSRGQPRTDSDIETGRIMQVERALAATSGMKGIEPPKKMEAPGAPVQPEVQAGQGGDQPPPPPRPPVAQGEGHETPKKKPQETYDKIISDSSKVLEEKLGPDAVKNFKLGDPNDPIEKLAASAREKEKTDDTPSQLEQAALYFVEAKAGKAEAARISAQEKIISDSVKVLEEKLGPDAVKNFKPGDPNDPIEKLAQTAREKHETDETPSQLEQAALYFVEERGVKKESPIEAKARANAKEADFNNASALLGSILGESAVRNFKPDDPADPIVKLAKSAMEKSAKGDTLKPAEEAAVMFVVYSQTEADKAAKMSPAERKKALVESLASPKNIAEFARKLALGDSAALKSLNDLPPAMRVGLEAIARDPEFQIAAKQDDKTFSAAWPKIYAARENVRRGFDAARRTLVPSPDDIIAVYLGSPGSKERKDAMKGFSLLKPDEQQAVISRLRSEGKSIDAMQLTELAGLSGPRGLELEISAGLRPGELAEIYARSDGIYQARAEIAQKLKISTNPMDDYVFGLITTGGLPQNLKELYPGTKHIEIKDIGGGATGAYKITITDQSGTHVEFLKKVDMRADKAGSDNLNLAGIIAPDVIVANKAGQPFTFVRPDGSVSAYGITRNIASYEKEITISGQNVKLKAEKVVGIAEMFDSPEMRALFAQNPQMFYEELGFAFAGQTAVGAIDGHGGNLFAGVFRIENATPEKIAALRNAGHHLLQYPNGDWAIFKITRIDTDDSAGTYWATGTAGSFDFSRLQTWLADTHVFPKLMASLARARNEQIMRECGPYEFMVPYDQVTAYKNLGWPVTVDQFGRGHIETYSPQDAARLGSVGLPQIKAPVREPVFTSPLKISQELFGTVGDGPFFKGMQRWVNEFGSDPEFRKKITDNFKSNEGEPVGVSSFFPNDAMKAQLARDGITYNSIPNNGEGSIPVYFSDGRTRMISQYEKVGSIALWPADMQSKFPPNTPVYVVGITEAMAASMPGNVFRNGGKVVAVFKDWNDVPAGLRSQAVAAVNNHGSIRAGSGFGAMIGEPVRVVGAIPVFNYIMDNGMFHMKTEFMRVQGLYEYKEKLLQNQFLDPAAPPSKEKAAFLFHRLPPGFGPDKFPP
jgi:hypothetical protein